MIDHIILQYDPFCSVGRLIYTEAGSIKETVQVACNDLRALAEGVSDACIDHSAPLSISAPDLYFEELKELITDYTICKYNRNIERIEQI